MKKSCSECLALPLYKLEYADFDDSLGKGNFLDSDWKEWKEKGEKGEQPVKGQDHLDSLKVEWKCFWKMAQILNFTDWMGVEGDANLDGFGHILFQIWRDWTCQGGTWVVFFFYYFANNWKLFSIFKKNFRSKFWRINIRLSTIGQTSSSSTQLYHPLHQVSYFSP